MSVLCLLQHHLHKPWHSRIMWPSWSDIHWMFSSFICLWARVWEDCITHKWAICELYRSHQTTIDKSSVDHVAIHYAYATCFTGEEKILKTLLWVKFLYFYIMKPNSFICISLNLMFWSRCCVSQWKAAMNLEV